MPKVTALRSGRPGRARVELDGAAWRTLPLDVVARAGLAVGLELDRPRLRTLRRELRRHEALDEAARALRTRDCSSASLRKRLERRGVAEEPGREALHALERAGILDDKRYARSKAERLAERGAGDALIRWELEQDGVPAELVEEALSALERETERAVRIAAGSRDAGRTARALARKGFSEDALEAAFPALVAELRSPTVRYED
ncbi:MAG: RecX family transcriptional regulator [Actinomycetota bacterium]|nr:RecX family transcriptional regulator [Actinomycetota bacterium]